MTPAFGFSVGDFVTVIELCTKVGKALKRTGGAASEYQHVIIELQGLQNVLARLTALEPSESTVGYVNAIRGMALATQFPLREFLARLDKYDRALDPFASSRVTGAGKKARWAIFIVEDVNKLRALISAKVISINLLLATHASETLSRMEQSGKSQHQESLEKIREQCSTLNNLSNRVQDVEATVRSNATHLANDLALSASRMENNLASISSDTTNISHQMNGLSIGLASAEMSLLSLRSVGAQINILRSNMQMYYMLLTIDNKVAASPTLLLQTNIRLEDSLGVVRELPYEWFRYWEPLEGLLRAQFIGKPGSDKVESGQYHLVYARRPTVPIEKHDWPKLIQPASEVIMLMDIKESGWLPSSCPRPSCSWKLVASTDEKSLTICTSLAPEPAQPEDVVSRQLIEDEQLFGEKQSSAENIQMQPSNTRHDETLEVAKDIQRVKASPTLRLEGESVEIQSSIFGNLRASASKEEARPWNPPTMHWLDETVQRKDPMITHEKQDQAYCEQDSMRYQEVQDLEYFRNVHVAEQTERVAPVEPPESNPRLQEGKNGMYFFYRNIYDCYPRIESYRAHRLAAFNWARTKHMIAPVLGAEEVNFSGSSGFGSSKQKETSKLDFQTRRHSFLDSDSGPEPSYSENYWTQRSHPSSSASSMNSSLRDVGVSNLKEWPPSKLSLTEISSKNIFSTEDATVEEDPYSDQHPTLQEDPDSQPKSRPKHWENLPPPPTTLGSCSSFICDICGRKTGVTSMKQWGKHVLDDLRPYCCLHLNCVSSTMTFSRRRDLIDHEVKVHKTFFGFYKCVYHGCQAKLRDPVSVMLHQFSNHGVDMATLKGGLSDSMTISTTRQVARPEVVLIELAENNTCEGHGNGPRRYDLSTWRCHDCGCFERGLICGSDLQQIDRKARFNPEYVVATVIKREGIDLDLVWWKSSIQHALSAPKRSLQDLYPTLGMLGAIWKTSH
ncbi:hypothetical protein EV356DRAFT_515376 [Viridothelium virens]|uniref:C2H2-type domain-containing protein n=1 Tax=Viridothelium virens TaxID=1048519 RepID=A0A6A6HMN8_VIRVR|nr:hypothetical protein EV356DRAFT_515376 [Viridothelium virens]